MKLKLLIPFLLVFLMSFKQQGYNIDNTIDNFSLQNALDNTTVSLSDFARSKAVVVVFSSTSCAFSKIYDERLVTLANSFKDKEVNFIFINPNNPALSSEDSPEAMAKRAKEKGYLFPFLIDRDQKIAGLFGASKTPEAFVLKNVNGSFVLKYKGAIDDNPQLASEVSSTYLKDAIQAVVSNSPVKITEKKATGCMIRK